MNYSRCNTYLSCGLWILLLSHLTFNMVTMSHAAHIRLVATTINTDVALDVEEEPSTLHAVSISRHLGSNIADHVYGQYLITMAPLPSQGISSLITEIETFANIKIGQYLGDSLYTYMFVSAPENALKASSHSSVEWVGRMLPSYKLSPDVVPIDTTYLTNNNYFNTYCELSRPILIELCDLPLNGERSYGSVEDLAAYWQQYILKSFRSHPKTTVSVSSTRILTLQICYNVKLVMEWLSQQRDTRQFSLLRQVSSHNGYSTKVMQSNTKDKSPVWEAGFTGTGQVIAIADTGLDMSHCFFASDTSGTKLTPFNVSSKTYSQLNIGSASDKTQRKVVMLAYNLVGTSTAPYEAGAGHGTHVTGVAVGLPQDTSSTIFPLRGLAYGAKVAFTDIQDESTQGALNGIPSDLSDTFFLLPYNAASARVFSNSWGTSIEDITGKYGSFTQNLDQLSFRFPEVLFIQSAGNDAEKTSSDGAVFRNYQNRDGYRSVTSPADAKNVITVGAARNAAESWLDTAYCNNCAKGVFYSNPKFSKYYSPDNIASFSSRGPTYDGRRKPDVVAVGESLLSSASSSATTPSAHCDSRKDHGTSQAAPNVAAAAAIVRQYLSSNYIDTTGYASGKKGQTSPTTPITGAIVKSIIVNSAQDLLGYVTLSVGPHRSVRPVSDDAGFGRVQLDSVLPLSETGNLKMFAKWGADAAIAAGQVNVIARLLVSDKTVPLKVTLVWMDPPSSTSSSIGGLMHDLDLWVTCPDGTVILGNRDRYGQNYDPTLPDTVNTVEQVRIFGNAQFSGFDSWYPLQTGDYVISIKAPAAFASQSDLNTYMGGKQQFGVVATGAFTIVTSGSPKCPNDCKDSAGVSRGTCSGGQCICNAITYGPDCRKSLCTSSTCLNGGTCDTKSSSNLCNCANGFTGPTCNIKQCFLSGSAITLSGSSGYFNSTNGLTAGISYHASSTCAWQIPASVGKYVVIQMKAVDLEYGHDYLSFYDGTADDNNSVSKALNRQLGAISGSLTTADAQTRYFTSKASNSGVYIEFVTDASNDKSMGFLATYRYSLCPSDCNGLGTCVPATGTCTCNAGYFTCNTGCCVQCQGGGGITVSTPTGIVASQFGAFDTNYDTYYPAGTVCSWNISPVLPNKLPVRSILLQVTNLETEFAPCNKVSDGDADYLQLYDSSGSGGYTSIGKQLVVASDYTSCAGGNVYDGSSGIQKVEDRWSGDNGSVDGSSVIVKFTSNSKNQYSGFKLKYTASACRTNCNNGVGACQDDGTCSCGTKPFYGYSCLRPICPNSCNSATQNGFCISTKYPTATYGYASKYQKACSCNAGNYGDDCSLAMCQDGQTILAFHDSDKKIYKITDQSSVTETNNAKTCHWKMLGSADYAAVKEMYIRFRRWSVTSTTQSNVVMNIYTDCNQDPDGFCLKTGGVSTAIEVNAKFWTSTGGLTSNEYAVIPPFSNTSPFIHTPKTVVINGDQAYMSFLNPQKQGSFFTAEYLTEPSTKSYVVTMSCALAIINGRAGLQVTFSAPTDMAVNTIRAMNAAFKSQQSLISDPKLQKNWDVEIAKIPYFMCSLVFTNDTFSNLGGNDAVCTWQSASILNVLFGTRISINALKAVGVTIKDYTLVRASSSQFLNSLTSDADKLNIGPTEFYGLYIGGLANKMTFSNSPWQPPTVALVGPTQVGTTCSGQNTLTSDVAILASVTNDYGQAVTVTWTATRDGNPLGPLDSGLKAEITGKSGLNKSTLTISASNLRQPDAGAAAAQYVIICQVTNFVNAGGVPATASLLLKVISKPSLRVLINGPPVVTIATSVLTRFQSFSPVISDGCCGTKSCSDVTSDVSLASQYTYLWSLSDQSGAAIALPDARSVTVRLDTTRLAYGTATTPKIYQLQVVVAPSGSTATQASSFSTVTLNVFPPLLRVLIQYQNMPDISGLGVSATAGSSITLTAVATNIDGSPLTAAATYQWNCAEIALLTTGVTCDTTTTASLTYSYQVNVFSTFVFSVTVTDGVATNTVSTKFIISPSAAPIVVIKPTFGTTVYSSGSMLDFTASITYPAGVSGSSQDPVWKVTESPPRDSDTGKQSDWLSSRSNDLTRLTTFPVPSTIPIPSNVAANSAGVYPIPVTRLIVDSLRQTIPSGTSSANLGLYSAFLVPGSTYKVECQVQSFTGVSGIASYSFTVASGPIGGTCTWSMNTQPPYIPSVTLATVACSNWNGARPLNYIYEIYASTGSGGTVRVVDATTASTMSFTFPLPGTASTQNRIRVGIMDAQGSITWSVASKVTDTTVLDFTISTASIAASALTSSLSSALNDPNFGNQYFETNAAALKSAASMLGNNRASGSTADVDALRNILLTGSQKLIGSRSSSDSNVASIVLSALTGVTSPAVAALGTSTIKQAVTSATSVGFSDDSSYVSFSQAIDQVIVGLSPATSTPTTSPSLTPTSAPTLAPTSGPTPTPNPVSVAALADALSSLQSLCLAHLKSGARSDTNYGGKKFATSCNRMPSTISSSPIPVQLPDDPTKTVNSQPFVQIPVSTAVIGSFVSSMSLSQAVASNFYVLPVQVTATDKVAAPNSVIIDISCTNADGTARTVSGLSGNDRIGVTFSVTSVAGKKRSVVYYNVNAKVWQNDGITTSVSSSASTTLIALTNHLTAFLVVDSTDSTSDATLFPGVSVINSIIIIACCAAALIIIIIIIVCCCCCKKQPKDVVRRPEKSAEQTLELNPMHGRELAAIVAVAQNDLTPQEEEIIRATFAAFDPPRRGLVDKALLRQLVYQCVLNMNLSATAELVEVNLQSGQIDLDSAKTGFVEEEEFIRWFPSKSWGKVNTHPQALSTLQLSVIARVFSRYDTNQDGSLEPAEIGILCKDIASQMGMGKQFTHAELRRNVEEGMAKMDINRDGAVSFDEFVPWFANRFLGVKEKIVCPLASWEHLHMVLVLFSRFDTNGSGTLDANEMPAFLTTLFRELRLPIENEAEATRQACYELGCDEGLETTFHDFLGWFARRFSPATGTGTTSTAK